MQVLMMRRRQDGNGEDESMDPIGDFTNTSDMGTSPPALPATLAEANPPAARNHHQQPPPPAAPAPPRQPLSVDIPTRDSLPEHRIQVWLQLLDSKLDAHCRRCLLNGAQKSSVWPARMHRSHHHCREKLPPCLHSCTADSILVSALSYQGAALDQRGSGVQASSCASSCSRGTNMCQLQWVAQCCSSRLVN